MRWLLENREGLLPESVLVLTYNVKAARELQARLDAAVGPAMRARMTVTNIHGRPGRYSRSVVRAGSGILKIVQLF